MTASRPQLSTRGRAVGRITAPRLRSARWPPTGVLLVIPASALAQASPFNTGANSLLQFTLTMPTAIAALIVIGLAMAAARGENAGSWLVWAVIGIADIFGARHVVQWMGSTVGV